MKVLLVAHGFPPELLGGTELSVRALAHELLALGHAVVVVAGSMAWEQGFRLSTEHQATPHGELVVHRIHRDDLYFDHWHKAREPRVAAAFAELLGRERPDLVHVHHWVRLSDDLVATAARAGVPAVVTLHDLWSTCLVTFRVRPDTRAFCTATLAPDPCLDCARVLEPSTPWVGPEAGAALLEERRAAIARELRLARAVIAPSRAHAEGVARWGGFGALEPITIPPGIDRPYTRRDPPPAPGPGAPLRIGVWGHLTPLKGADLVLTAVRALSDPRAVRVELAGGEVDPAYAARLRELAEGLDVRFHGAYAAEALDEHPAADVHLMVSGSRAHESWGLVLDEALRLGIPALVPDSGAFPERLEGADWGRTYAAGDAEALARVLAELVADPGATAALRAAVPAADAGLGAAEHARRTVAVYERALALGPPAVPPADPYDETAAAARRERWDRACRGEGERRLRILEVVHDYLPGHVGGTEIHAHQMARHLTARGHAVTVATTERDLSVAEGTVRRRELDGIPIHELVHQREYAHMRESWRHPVAPAVFERLLDELRPDLVHFHHLAHWGAECVALAERAGARVVVTLNDFHLLCNEATLLAPDGELCERGPEGGCTACIAHLPLPGVAADDPLRGYHLGELMAERLETARHYLARVPRVLCPSRFLADRMVRAGVLREEQVLVKRYGYPGPTHPARPVRRDGPLRVGYVGGIYPSKGVHVLVEAAARLEPGLVEVDVHGVLEWFPDYVERLRALAGDAAVHFRGGFDPADVDRVMQGFDVLVVPSVWYENMPLTIQEAFRNAVPVVTTDLGGMAEAVRDGVDGLLFPRGDAAALAERLARLARDRDLVERLVAARPPVPSVERIGGELEALYLEAVGERAAAGGAADLAAGAGDGGA